MRVLPSLFAGIVIIALFALSIVAMVDAQKAVFADYGANSTKSIANDPTRGGSLTTRFYNGTVSNYFSNYTKSPLINIKKPHEELKYDVVVTNPSKLRFDPRTCPNDLAYCYQIIKNAQNATTRDVRVNASAPLLPEERVRTYICVGNDTKCVQSSMNCYCPETSVPPPPELWSSNRCTENTHLCLNSFGSFALCTGNVTDCRKKFTSCGCGTNACISNKNTCVNAFNNLLLCTEPLASCLGKYKTCYCGPDMMSFNKGCQTSSHSCTKAGKNIICKGTFSDCALRYDTCTC